MLESKVEVLVETVVDGVEGLCGGVSGTGGSSSTGCTKGLDYLNPSGGPRGVLGTRRRISR